MNSQGQQTGWWRAPRVGLCLPFALTIALFLTQSAAATGGGTVPPPVQEAYRIHVADVLELTFFKTTSLNQRRTVGPDGQVSFVLVGQVSVVGRSVADLTQELTERYGRELVGPQLTLSVQEFSGMKIYVGGEVNGGGMLPYRGGLTVVQAIMNAGGFRPTARRSEVVLIRQGQEGKLVGSVINVGRILKRSKFGEDVALVPSDIVFVPRSRVANLNLFVEQYIRQNLPIPLFFNYGVAK